MNRHVSNGGNPEDPGIMEKFMRLARWWNPPSSETSDDELIDPGKHVKAGKDLQKTAPRGTDLGGANEKEN